MSNVTVTILQNGRCDDYGIPLVAGSSYSLDYDRAKSLWQAGFASVTDPNVFDDDNTPVDGNIVRVGRFADFRKCLLASLVANSTASRTNGVVTLTAPSHGITTGTTYSGFRFFYPGSAALAAGWYDSIITVPDANTVTFSAPGADFGSQSVNGAAAYTTITTVPGQFVIPAGSLIDDSVVRVSVVGGGGTTGATKSLRPVINGTSLSIATATGFPFCTRDWEIFSLSQTSLGCTFIQYNGAASSFTSAVVDKTKDITVQLSVSVLASGDFMVLYPPARVQFVV